MPGPVFEVVQQFQFFAVRKPGFVGFAAGIEIFVDSVYLLLHFPVGHGAVAFQHLFAMESQQEIHCFFPIADCEVVAFFHPQFGGLQEDGYQFNVSSSSWVR